MSHVYLSVINLEQHGFGLGMTTAPPPPVKRHKSKSSNSEEANSGGGGTTSSVLARSYTMPLGCTGITGSYAPGSFSYISHSRHAPNACFHSYILAPFS